MNKEYIEELSFDIIGAAIEVHKFLRKGLLESVYHECLKEELKYRKLNFETKKSIPIIYRDKKLSSNFRCDLLVENCIVVELKSVVEVHPVFESQVLTYMNLLKVPKGILINFNSNNIFRDGQKTFVNEIYSKLK
ncbi:GxxExxY protein [Flavobacterium terrigena]|uniref:GxxExxY protein n=1 Tax=Flavobacterium terrigena TaxID=402734 RepID=A0A1H6WUG7_9FLAO|nr:GxxExxY protein [Flavobacterium terrigena]SEJ18924.1 GxxExxY protein [Flavobacterium terrigena]